MRALAKSQRYLFLYSLCSKTIYAGQFLHVEFKTHLPHLLS